jgi:hypothetical protein
MIKSHEDHAIEIVEIESKEDVEDMVHVTPAVHTRPYTLMRTVVQRPSLDDHATAIMPFP